MKRLIIILFLSGLYLSSQAVNITVIRMNGKTDEIEKLSVIKFLSGNTIQCKLTNGRTKQVDNVRTITFDDIDTAVDNVISESSISVYPNPTADMLIVEGVTAKETIHIYSLNGNQVLSVMTQEGVNTINVSGLPNGVYLLKYANESFKLIKE